MYPVFGDAQTDQEFQRNGFVVRPFLNADEREALVNILQSSTPDVPIDYFATPFSQDPAYRRRVHEEVKAILYPHAKDLMPGHKLSLAGFVVKRPKGAQGKVWLHNDYSFVDPTRHIAVHVWCPLTDVDENNGCLKAVVGSHNCAKHFAAIPTNPSPYDRVRPTLDAQVTTSVPMTAGEAFLFDQRLLHGSSENQTDELRIAAMCALIPENVAPRFYCWEKERPTQLKVLELPEDYLVTFKPETVISEPYPDGVLCIETIDYEPQFLGPEQVDELRGLQTGAPAAKAASQPEPMPATASVQPTVAPVGTNPPRRTLLQRFLAKVGPR